MTAQTQGRGGRTIWIIAGVAVLALVAGIVLGRFVKSPAQAASEAAPPTAGPVSVPVELRTLSNDVVLRADVTYDDPTSVTVETGGIDGPAIVTGQIPEVGANVEAGSVILEIMGRPVILLPGELPTYRTIRAGSTGPDVLQLKEALAAIGLEPGDVTSSDYDAATASALGALYARIGYPAPAVDQETRDGLDAARAMVRDAQNAVAEAERALAEADQGVPESARLEADATVAEAERALAVAQKPDCSVDPCVPSDPNAVASARERVAIAHAQRDEALKPPSTASFQQALADARSTLQEATTAQAEAQAATLMPAPAAEIVFAPSLPRRVDDVNAQRGQTLTGSAMVLSGATLTMTANASAADARLLEVGAEGSLTLPDDSELTVTVESVGASRADDQGEGSSGGESSGRSRVVFSFPELTPDQVTMLQDSNVRVTVPVSSTGGDVLAVPLAALTAGPGGQSRVEVLGDDGTTHLVTVTPGLAAAGYAEVEPVEGDLTEGDLVVIGTERAASASDGESTEPAATDETDAEDAG